MLTNRPMALFVAGGLALGAGVSHAGQATAPKADAKPATTAAPAKGPAPERFEDWRLQCQKPQNAPAEVCELTQLAIAMNNKDQGTAPQGEAKGQLLLTVGILRPMGAEEPRMILRAPLGVYLQPIQIKVPGHKDIQVPFLRCDQSGCYSVGLALAKEFLDAAKAVDAAIAKDPKAPNGTVTIALQVAKQGAQAQPTPVQLPLSMKGITKGLAALEAKSPKAAPAKDAGKEPAKDKPKKK